MHVVRLSDTDKFNSEYWWIKSNMNYKYTFKLIWYRINKNVYLQLQQDSEIELVVSACKLGCYTEKYAIPFPEDFYFHWDFLQMDRTATGSFWDILGTCGGTFYSPGMFS